MLKYRPTPVGSSLLPRPIYTTNLYAIFAPDVSVAGLIHSLYQNCGALRCHLININKSKTQKFSQVEQMALDGAFE